MSLFEKHKVEWIALVVVFSALFFGNLSGLGLIHQGAAVITKVLFIGLPIFWGISIHHRILNRHTHRYLISSSILMVFWMAIRMIKYYFVTNPLFLRQLWYWYYFPMLFLPLILLFISITLGKPEYYKPPHWFLFLAIPTFILFLIVLTNDFHELVFRFPDRSNLTDEHYLYNLGFYPIFAWGAGLASTGLAIILYKFHSFGRKIHYPILVYLAMLFYLLAYFLNLDWLDWISRDLTLIFCLYCIAIVETCIKCDLLPSNKGYELLFDAASYRAQIRNKTGELIYSSHNPLTVSKEELQASHHGPTYLDMDTLLFSHPIDGGYVYWCEDIRPINELLEQLEKNKAILAKNNLLDEEMYQRKLDLLRLREKNRLYQKFYTKTSHQMQAIDQLVQQYTLETDEKSRLHLLNKIAILGTYIKRVGNLLVLQESSKTTDSLELVLCLKESLTSLNFLGVTSALDIPEGRSVLTQDIIDLYDFFEELIEACDDSISYLWIKGRMDGPNLVISFECECPSDKLSQLGWQLDALYEDGVFRVTKSLECLGERV